MGLLIRICKFSPLMDNCLVDCIDYFANFTASAACTFTTDHCDQDTVQFIQGYYCILHESVSLLLILSVPLSPLRYACSS